MTLFMSADDVVKVLKMPDCIEAMERVFREEAEGGAVNHPRQRYTLPTSIPLGEQGWWTNMIGGAAESTGFAALRVDSGIVREHEVDGRRRMEWEYPDARSWGFVLLFELMTGKPVAVFHDFSLSPIRVAATTAVAARELSRPDASVMALLGTGNEAERHLEALALVRELSDVRVYSPNERHCREFVERMGDRVAASLEAVSGPEEAMRDADIVMCATNSSVPVFDGNWLRAGQFAATIVNTDHNTQRSEADATTFERSDLIVLNSTATAVANNQVELLDLIEAGTVSWDDVTELGHVLAEPSAGRQSNDDIIYYKSNCGVGIQFAAAGALILQKCQQAGRGTEVPTELFGADVSWWLDRGFKPSP